MIPKVCHVVLCLHTSESMLCPSALLWLRAFFSYGGLFSHLYSRQKVLGNQHLLGETFNQWQELVYKNSYSLTLQELLRSNSEVYILCCLSEVTSRFKFKLPIITAWKQTFYSPLFLQHPASSLMCPGVTSPINYLFSNPSAGVCFGGTANKDFIVKVINITYSYSQNISKLNTINVFSHFC